MSKHAIFFILLCFFESVAFGRASAVSYYVSPSGNDGNNGTALSAPLKTIQAWIGRARSGDTVYVLDGTYRETVRIADDGITLAAYSGAAPVIDGGTDLPQEDWWALVMLAGNYDTISGFEVKNGNASGKRAWGYGIQITGHHNAVSDMDVHHIWAQGIMVNGDHNTVEGCRIWQSSRQNAFGSRKTSSAWASGMSAARNASDEAIKPGYASYAVFRKNTVYNNWWEGLSCFEADHCTMEDNTVYDNWATDIYLSDATYSIVQRNLVYTSAKPDISFGNADSRKHAGITLADEQSDKTRSSYNAVLNNLVYNADISAFSWTLVPGSWLNNVVIANNTVVDGNLDTGAGGSFWIVNTRSAIVNNIVTGSDSAAPDRTGIVFSHNNWKTWPKNTASDGDIFGDPQISRAGSPMPGKLTADYFKLLPSSPAIHKALFLRHIPQDFFGTARWSAPSLGAYEYDAKR